MLNRILSRSKRTIWCDGDDIPTVLTLRRALVAIAYLYANQVKDNLESTIENYPGFSTSKSISLPCTKSFGNRTSCCARNAPTSTKVSSCVSSRGPPPTGPGAPERRMRTALSTGPPESASRQKRRVDMSPASCCTSTRRVPLRSELLLKSSCASFPPSSYSYLEYTVQSRMIVR